MKYIPIELPDDLVAVHDVAEAAFSDTQDSSLEEWFDFEEMANQIRAKRGMCLKAIDEQDEVVGMIYGQQENPIHNNEGREKWVISIIGVHPKVKGKQVGSQLITAFESYAKSRGAIKLFVFTNKSDKDIVKFYQKNGYEDAGWIRDYQYGQGNSAVFLLKYL